MHASSVRFPDRVHDGAPNGWREAVETLAGGGLPRCDVGRQMPCPAGRNAVVRQTFGDAVREPREAERGEGGHAQGSAEILHRLGDRRGLAVSRLRHAVDHVRGCGAEHEPDAGARQREERHEVRHGGDSRGEAARPT